MYLCFQKKIYTFNINDYNESRSKQTVFAGPNEILINELIKVFDLDLLLRPNILKFRKSLKVAFLSLNLKKLLLFSKPISLVGEIVFSSPSNQWKVQIKKFWMVVGN